MSEKDFMTPYEVKKAELHDKVCKEYKKLLGQVGDSVSKFRIMTKVAKRCGLTLSGVRRILVVKGIYEPTRSANDRRGDSEAAI